MQPIIVEQFQEQVEVQISSRPLLPLPRNISRRGHVRASLVGRLLVSVHPKPWDQIEAFECIWDTPRLYILYAFRWIVGFDKFCEALGRSVNSGGNVDSISPYLILIFLHSLVASILFVAWHDTVDSRIISQAYRSDPCPITNDLFIQKPRHRDEHSGHSSQALYRERSPLGCSSPYAAV